MFAQRPKGTHVGQPPSMMLLRCYLLNTRGSRKLDDLDPKPLVRVMLPARGSWDMRSSATIQAAGVPDQDNVPTKLLLRASVCEHGNLSACVRANLIVLVRAANVAGKSEDLRCRTMRFRS